MCGCPFFYRNSTESYTGVFLMWVKIFGCTQVFCFAVCCFFLLHGLAWPHQTFLARLCAPFLIRPQGMIIMVSICGWFMMVLFSVVWSICWEPPNPNLYLADSLVVMVSFYLFTAHASAPKFYWKYWNMYIQKCVLDNWLLLFVMQCWLNVG